jgi:hypothetical protein
MVLGRPEEMNCSMAICAVASCMATRSAPGAAGGRRTGVALRRRRAGGRPGGQGEAAQGGARARGDALGGAGVGARTGAQPQVAGAALDVLALGVVQVAVDHLRRRAARWVPR